MSNDNPSISQAILAFDVFGPSSLDDLLFNINCSRRSDHSLYRHEKISFSKGVADAIENLLADGRISIIPKITNLFKAHGLSELLDGMEKWIPAIIDGFVNSQARNRQESEPVINFRYSSKQRWSRSSQEVSDIADETQSDVYVLNGDRFRNAPISLGGFVQATPEARLVFDLALSLSENPALLARVRENLLTRPRLWQSVHEVTQQRREDPREIVGLRPDQLVSFIDIVIEQRLAGREISVSQEIERHSFAMVCNKNEDPERHVEGVRRALYALLSASGPT